MRLTMAPPRVLVPRLAPVLLALALAAGCHDAPGPSRADAGTIADRGTIADTASSPAPALETAPAPAPPPPGAAAAADPGAEPSVITGSPARATALACPRGMMAVTGAPAGGPAVTAPFCIDKWEASLVDKRTGLELSPYYPPDRRFAIKLAETWEKQRLEVGSDEARRVPLPPLPEWQRRLDVEPVAISQAGVVPNGYLSGVMAERACRNADKRLCRYDEWLTACKGEAGRRFPYGDEYRQGACNIFRALHPAMELHNDVTLGHLDPRLDLVREPNGDPLLHLTGATPACKSEWGHEAAWDMNGNLDEWVDDEKGRFAGGFYSRARRDGCENSITAHPPTYLDYSTGARCCWSPP